MPSRRIESFDFLLRDLVNYGLVERDDDSDDGRDGGRDLGRDVGRDLGRDVGRDHGRHGGGTWRLSEVARARLDELDLHRGGSVLPENLVYFDHRCAGCGQRALTRLRDGVYLCEPCSESRGGAAGVSANSSTT